MNSLPFTPVAQPNESPLSLLQRAAIGNGYSNLMALIHSLDTKIDHSKGMLGFIARNPALYKTLCNKLGISNECIEKTTYLRTGHAREDSVLWHGIEIEMGDLECHKQKICIACYLETGYTHFEWDHYTVNTCPTHAVFLDHCCPICKTAWRYKEAPLTCSCDHKTILKQLRKVECSKNEVIQKSLSIQNQGLFTFLSNLRRVFVWWKSLGVFLTQEEQYTVINHFSQGLWPPKLNNILPHLHTRTLLLPMLSVENGLSNKLTKKLLKHEYRGNQERQFSSAHINHSQTQVLLNISRARFKPFVKEELLIKSEDGVFSLSEVETLMEKSSWLPFTEDKAKQWQENRYIGAGSLAAKIKQEISGEPTPNPSKETSDYLNIKEAAKRLDTNTESVRFLIKLELLEATKGSPISPVQWVITKTALNTFEKKYIFASNIAKHHGLSVTTITDRIRAQGVNPVSGPSIDTGKTFLFLKREIEELDITLLKGDYISSAGRKATNSPADTISSHELASMLDIDTHQVRYIVKENWIDGSKNSKGNYRFLKSDALALKVAIEQDYIDIEKARQLMGQSLQSFRRTWLISGFVTAKKFAKYWLVSIKDFKRIQILWDRYKTSTHIGASLNRERHLCPNLDTMRLLKKSYSIGIGTKKINFYPYKSTAYPKYDRALDET